MALKPGPGAEAHGPLWRDEFSVRAEDEKFVTRRQFAKFLTLTSVAMAAGNVWILVKSWMQRAPAYPVRVVATAGEMPVGGVKLFNYPERLAYSATPPDFGSLLIQRRRWANGGVIIVPKLMRYLTARNDGPGK